MDARTSVNRFKSKQVQKEENNQPRFDKKQWKQKTYKGRVGNVNEGQGFADERKRLMVKEYKRMLKKEQPQLELMTSKVQQVYNEEAESLKQLTERRRSSSAPNDSQKPDIAKDDGKSKMSIFKKAQLEHQKRVEEVKLKQEKFERDKEARQKALKQYKEKKFEKNKILRMKTKKGQPFMKPRLKLLYEEVKMQMAKEEALKSQ